MRQINREILQTIFKVIKSSVINFFILIKKNQYGVKQSTKIGNVSVKIILKYDK